MGGRAAMVVYEALGIFFSISMATTVPAWHAGLSAEVFHEVG